MTDSSSAPSCKVILLGNAAVGKTSIVLQFYKSTFPEDSVPTIGAAYITKIIDTSKGQLSLNVWDTAGQERFRSIIPMYLRGAAAVIFVCSPDQSNSVEDLKKWKELLEKTPDLKMHGYVVLNKSDLADDSAILPSQQFAKDNNYAYFLTSAKNNTNITELFNKIAEDVAQDTIFESVQKGDKPLRVKKEHEGGCC